MRRPLKIFLALSLTALACWLLQYNAKNGRSLAEVVAVQIELYVDRNH